MTPDHHQVVTAGSLDLLYIPQWILHNTAVATIFSMTPSGGGTVARMAAKRNGRLGSAVRSSDQLIPRMATVTPVLGMTPSNDGPLNGSKSTLGGAFCS